MIVFCQNISGSEIINRIESSNSTQSLNSESQFGKSTKNVSFDCDETHTDRVFVESGDQFEQRLFHEKIAAQLKKNNIAVWMNDSDENRAIKAAANREYEREIVKLAKQNAQRKLIVNDLLSRDYAVTEKPKNKKSCWSSLFGCGSHSAIVPTGDNN